MHPKNSPLLPYGGKAMLAPFLCAIICIALIHTGFFSFFFLVPLGFCAAAFGPAPAWISFVIAAFGNAILSIGFSLRYGSGLANAGMEILFFSALALGFTWIMAGNPMLSVFRAMPQARTAFRFIAASIAGSFVLLGMIYSIGRNENFLALARSQIEAVSSGLIASSGADAARQETMERLFVPEKIIETIFSVSFRGAALVSVFFMFFISRQIAFMLARLIMKKGNAEPTGGDLIRFHAPKKAIWFFSICLPVIVVCGIFSLKYVDIAAWNLLAICAILFVAQGGGIVLHYLARRPMPAFTRLLGSLLFVLLVFSPGVNLAAIGALVLLGIAENWLPLRISREQGTMSNEQ
jgi:hypothetical protein